MNARDDAAPDSAGPATTAPAPARGLTRLLPRSLFARVTLIFVIGLVLAQGLTFGAIGHERQEALRELMMTGIERDIASSIAILDRLPATERGGWLARLERPNYSFTLDGEVRGIEPVSPWLRDFGATIIEALKPFPTLRMLQPDRQVQSLELLVRLGDGSTVVVHARRHAMPVATWALWILAGQAVILSVVAWLAVRLVTRPLAELATAADALGPDLRAHTLEEGGPTEVAHAARAFNAMQRRIAGYMAERVEILASISHDLQTPITRMRLRADLMDDVEDRHKFCQDLDAMKALVQEGVAYARTLHGATEPASPVDVDALLESLVADYADAGEDVTLQGRVGGPVVTRPHALRRILTNLVDNALKFGHEVRMEVRQESGRMTIAILDRGPGIPPEHLEDVFKPFYRVEGSRNRGTGGTGLGLAIAQQLAMAIGAVLTLRNRPEGGLEARLTWHVAP